ncbi:MAG: hypothetical protein J6T42_02950, partial [Clostridia bacterium]|nr:hypothetical protein [Clostridia bacterium]
MRIFLIVILFVYVLAVNVYGFLLIKQNRDEEESGEQCCHKDSKYVITGALGGALGIYISMFVLRYRTKSLMLMAFMPVFVAITAFVVYSLFANNFFMPAEVSQEQVAESVRLLADRIFKIK